MYRLLALALLITATGCTAAQQGALSAAAQKRMAFNDTKANVALLGVCDITVGAFFRQPPSRQRAIEAVCGGEAMPRRPILAPDPIKER